MLYFCFIFSQYGDIISFVTLTFSGCVNYAAFEDTVGQLLKLILFFSVLFVAG